MDRKVMIFLTAFGVALGFVLYRRWQREGPLFRVPGGARGGGDSELLERLAGQMADTPFLRFGVGKDLLRQGRTAEAREKLSRALELDPSHVPARAFLGHAYYVEGRFAEAAEQYEALLGKAPGAAAWVEAARKALEAGPQAPGEPGPGLRGLVAMALPGGRARVEKLAGDFERLGRRGAADLEAVEKALFEMLLLDLDGTKGTEARDGAWGDWNILSSYVWTARMFCMYDEERIYRSYQEDYGDLIQELASISDHVLDGLEIRAIHGDYWSARGDEHGPRIRLRLGEKELDAKLRYRGDWVDTEGLLALLNQALETRGDERRYRLVKDPSGDQIIEVLFATQEQHEAYEALAAQAIPRRRVEPSEDEG
ncbi:MAG: tetratricopeptide repeat protein [Planctomycetes bacterium]|nr:tetratricopeptide repeat protein [Planctomycetota bacterium]